MPDKWRLVRWTDPFILGTSGKDNLLYGPLFVYGCNSIGDFLAITASNDIAICLLQKANNRDRRYTEGKSENDVAQTAKGKKGDHKVDVRGAKDADNLSRILIIEVSPWSGDALDRTIDALTGFRPDSRKYLTAPSTK